MYKHLLLSLIAFINFSVFAQNFDASFEQGSNDTLSKWNANVGLAKRLSSYTFSAKTGDTTVKPTNGNYFAKLNSVDSKIAEIQSFASHEKRSASIVVDVIFNYTDFTQRFYLNVIYTKWNVDLNKRDTIANSIKEYTTGGNNGEKRYNWLSVTHKLERSDFLMNGNPDSSYVKISYDKKTSTDDNSFLLIDNAIFSNDVISSTSNENDLINAFEVFPTLSSRYLNVKTRAEYNTFKIFDLEGREILEGKLDKGQSVIDISNTPLNKWLVLQISNGKNSLSTYFQHIN